MVRVDVFLLLLLVARLWVHSVWGGQSSVSVHLLGNTTPQNHAVLGPIGKSSAKTHTHVHLQMRRKMAKV